MTKNKKDNTPPNEIPNRKNPEKIKPMQDPDLQPDKNNPRNPKRDDTVL
jgi:hypothetical protein